MEGLMEGIDDYEMAPEFPEPLTDDTTLRSKLSDLWDMVNQVQGKLRRKEFSSESAESRAYVELLRSYYPLSSTEPEDNLGAEHCKDICMWCEPTKDELQAGKGFRSVLITRGSSWREKLNPLKPWSKRQCGRVGFEF